MDGTLTIIDGEPGRGKTLATIRLMIQSAKRGRNIITNVALKPEFTRRLQQKNYPITVIQPTIEEIEHFWEHTPSNCDVYIDEAHLIWDSDAWKTNRVAGFKSYISQFRKDGDSIWLLAQSYENLDKFIRQRATKIITCKRIQWPSFTPRIGGKPIAFIVTHWTTKEGERDQRNKIPEVYTPNMCRDLYTLYDTRGKVDTTRNTHTRTEWSQLTMPNILSQPGQGPQPGQHPIININNDQKKKSHPLLTTLVFAAAAAAAYALLVKHTAQRTRTYAPTNTQPHPQNDKITYYGAINHHIVLSQHGIPGNWPINTTVSKWTITGYNTDGIELKGPNGTETKRWWIPPPPKKTHNKKNHPEDPVAHLGL